MVAQPQWVGMEQSVMLTLAFKPLPNIFYSMPFRLYQRHSGMASRLFRLHDVNPGKGERAPTIVCIPAAFGYKIEPL